MTASQSAPPGRISDPPLMRLGELHGALRGDFRRPGGGGWWLLAFALAGLLYLLAASSDEPRRESERAAAVAGDGGAAGATAGRQAWTREEERLRQTLQEEGAPQPVEQPPERPKKPELGPVPPGHVRVAAAQLHSVFGEVERNRRRLAQILEEAAKLDVQIVALPEAAIPGYADVTKDRYWMAQLPDEEDFTIEKRQAETEAGESFTVYAVENREEGVYFELYDVRRVAEPRNGDSVRFFGKLAKEYGMYVTVPFIEKDDGAFYSSVVLVGPEGAPVLHLRKQQLWESGDGYWATPGKGAPPVVDTPYGRLGVNFSYGIRRLASLAKQEVDIVLQCSALYGKGFEGTFLSSEFIGAIKQAGFTLVIANWTYAYTPHWEGYGMSRIILPSGKTRRIRVDDADGMVIADLPIAGEAPRANE